MKHNPEKQHVDEVKTGSGGGLPFTLTPKTPSGGVAADSPGIGAFTAEMVEEQRALANKEGRSEWKSSKFEAEKETSIKRKIHDLKERRPLPPKEKEELEALYFELGIIKEGAQKRRAKTQLNSGQRESLRETVTQIKTSKENGSLNTTELMPLNEKLAHNIDDLAKTMQGIGRKEGVEKKEANKLLNAMREEKRGVEDTLTGYKPNGKLSREEFLAQKLLEAVGFKNKTPYNEDEKDSQKPTIFNLTEVNKVMQKDMDELAVQLEVEPATLNRINLEEKIMKQELPPLEFTHTYEQPKEKESANHTETSKEGGNVANKITQKNIEDSFNNGSAIEVNVKRSSGEVEKGWIVTGSDGKDAVVIKHGEDGKFMRKVIPLKELQELNMGEVPPLEFTQENTTAKEGVDVTRIEARVKEVSVRQKEIAEKTDIASIEEKVELEKEATSLEERRKEIEDNKPLHTAYDAAMARLQKEDKASIANLEPKTEIATENNVGNSQKLPAIEGEFTKRLDGEIKPVLGQEQILEINAKNAEKRDRTLGNFSKLEKQRETKAEKMGILDRVRAVGKKWNSLPKHYKLLFTAGLVLSGAGAAIVGSAVAGGAIATIAAGSRALAGAGLFATFEEMMRRSHERKTGSPITEAVAARQAVLSGTLAILMVSMLPTAMHNVLEGTGATEALASVKTTGVTEPTGVKHLAPTLPDQLLNNGVSLENKGLAEIAQAMQTGDIETVRLTEETLGITHEEAIKLIDERKILSQLETPTLTNLAEQASYIETAKSGDTVWGMTGEQLKAHYGEKFTGLPQNEQDRIIDAIENKIVKQPELIGLADAHKLAVNQSVDFGGIFVGDKEFIDAQFADAKQMVSLKDLSAISDDATTEPRDVLMEGSTPRVEQSEWLKQFNAHLAERMTDAQAQAYGNDIGKALAVNDMDKVFEIEKTMGITHEEFLRLVEETKKVEGSPQINIPVAPIHDALIPEATTETHTPVEKAVANAAPQEIVPKDPQVLAFADKQMHEHINSMFGTKGFLGFGSETGVDSAHWKHPKVGFGAKTVGEIMTAEPKLSYEDGSKHFGIEDSSATQKMQDYLKSMFKETGLQPKPEATVESYLKDAEAIKFGKLMNKG